MRSGHRGEASTLGNLRAGGAGKTKPAQGFPLSGLSFFMSPDGLEPSTDCLLGTMAVLEIKKKELSAQGKNYLQRRLIIGKI